MRFSIELSGESDPSPAPPLLEALSGEFEDYLGGGTLERCRSVSVVLTFASAERMRELNSRYRGADESTDVLSFPMWETGGEFVPPDGWRDLPLGDVVVSLEVVRQNANERDINYNVEVALVVVHGILHLIGFDHDTEHRREEMWAEQDRILSGYFNRVGGV
ncbi:MAG: rRNA maturation RNase YbeY [Synergistaceae bacterium]|jgi:probable rRNA maturation factor|nr:rRNA maturation RNase YbeY [Synergistaceae bacterium]